MSSRFRSAVNNRRPNNRAGSLSSVRMLADYKGASTDKKRTNWNAPKSSPNTSLGKDLVQLRNRALAGQRNSSLLKSAINNLVSHEVGTGIVPRAVSDDNNFNDNLDNWFEEWTNYCDPAEVLSFFGSQGLAVRCRRVSGEVFVRLRTAQTDDFSDHPLRIELLEPDYCPVELNQIAPNGNEIKYGIEFTKKGKRAAYWMYKEHPAEPSTAITFNGGQYVRIAAKHIIHHYMPLRPGQIRGEPDSAQSLLKTYTLESYDQAELERKETRAPFTGFVSRNEISDEDWDYDPLTGEKLEENSNGLMGMDLEAGTLVQGLPGESLTLFDGDKGNEAYADYMREQALQIAAGFGLPHAMMTGDYSGVNDRVIRADLNNFYRMIDAVAANYTVYQLCRVIRNRFIELAVMLRPEIAPKYFANKRNYQKTEWQAQPRAYIHPVQDIDAAVKAIDNNLDSEEDYLRRRGKNPDNIIQRRANFQKSVQKEIPVREIANGNGGPTEGEE
jgi:lambda family phage portal protein